MGKVETYNETAIRELDKKALKIPSNYKFADSIERLVDDYVPVLVSRVYATHAGMVNANYNSYRISALSGNLSKKDIDENEPDAVDPYGYKSLLYPYNKPVCLDHYMGNSVGMVVSAQLGTDPEVKKTALMTDLAVTDYETIQNILSGKLRTVSISGSAAAKCSVCGSAITSVDYWDGELNCGHVYGKTYDDKLCFFDVWKLKYHEISYTNSPADAYARVIEVATKDATLLYIRSFDEEVKKAVALYNIATGEEMDMGDTRNELFATKVRDSLKTRYALRDE